MLNNDNNLGYVDFIGIKSIDIFRAPYQISEHRLFCMKVLPNKQNYYVHAADTDFRDMLRNRLIFHHLGACRTGKGFYGVPDFASVTKPQCWMSL